MAVNIILSLAYINNCMFGKTVVDTLTYLFAT